MTPATPSFPFAHTLSKAPRGVSVTRQKAYLRVLSATAAVWVVLVAVATQCAPLPSPAAKKLIEYGWDVPTSAQMQAELATMERRPFDGLIFKLNGGYNAFVTNLLESAKFAEDERILRSLPFARFTNNFVLIWGSPPAGFDWFDDTQWRAIEANAKLLVSIGQAARIRGICFDPEPYDFSLWDYAKQP